MRQTESSSLGKALFLLALLAITMLSTSTVLQMYPQHLYLNNQTIINANIGNFENGHVNIKGNQVSYTQNDIIAVEGRDYIRITGKQVQISDSKYLPGIRQVTASLYQNILFEQRIGTFSINKIGQIIVDNEVINIIPLSSTAVNIKTVDSNYIVEFSQDITYITTNAGTMLKLTRTDSAITVSIIGLKTYNRLALKVI